MASVKIAGQQAKNKIEKDVEKLYPRIRKMAGYYASRSNLESEDLFQEACIGLLGGLNDLDPTIGTSQQYLLKRARWHVLDTLKKHYAGPGLFLDVVELGVEGATCGLQEQLEEQEFLACLTVKQRQIVADLLDGFTWREIGTRLACSSANVAYHIRDIRRMLKNWLGGVDRMKEYGNSL